MRLIGLDYETTGLDPEKDLITEMGLVLWCTEKKAPLEIVSVFFDWELTALDPVITELTGITLDMLREFGQEPKMIAQLTNRIAERSGATAFVAHNGAAFDSLFHASWMKKVGQPNHPLPWIDSQNDVPYAESIKTRKLTYLAAEHGFLNPFAHRAVFDVLTMFKVMDNYDYNAILALSKEPVVFLRADVTYSNRQEASGRGYRWQPEQKIWWRSFKESQVAKEKIDAPFRTVQINEPPKERR